jgi:hypothetical protein
LIWKEPVATEHVGWVTDPALGADGVVGCALTVIVDEADDVQPSALSTVNV